MLYRRLGPKGHSKSLENVPASVPVPGMKVPATISADGKRVSAVIPPEIDAFCFLIVDQNNYLQYSEVVAAE